MADNSFELWQSTFLRLARAEGWTFKAQGRTVEADEVFASNGFAPGLLSVAQSELTVRGFKVDLDLYLDSEVGGVLGVAVSFGESGQSVPGHLGRQYWRFATTSFVLDSLLAMSGPGREREITLDPLFAVFKPASAPALDEA